MKKAAHLTVRYRRYLIAVGLLLAAVCGVVSLRVPINADMTKYLPPDSRMKQGIDLMAEEFPDLSFASTIRVMFEDLPEGREEEVLAELKQLPDASSAVLTGTAQQGGRTYTLFTLSTAYDYRTEEELALEHSIPDAFAGYTVTVRNDDANGMEIPAFIFALALVILLLVLFAFCSSFAESFIFLFTIGIAILLNMGTNLILGSVSQTTYSMSAILQLVLSMDYSVILMNRFRQEMEKGGEKDDAMERAVIGALPSIASSGFTTVVGLLMLCFMRYRIGRDLGLVLAKGVFLSMLCCLTILPGLILLFYTWIEKSEKPVVHIPTGALSRFSYRFRYVLTAGFVVLFFGAWYVQSLSGTSYSLSQEDPIADVFPPGNPVIVLYDNEDEDAAAAFVQDMEGRDEVLSVYAYSTAIGRKMTASEMTDSLRVLMEGGLDEYASMAGDLLKGADSSALDNAADMLTEENVETVYRLCGMLSGEGQTDRLSIEQLFRFLGSQASNPLVRAAIGADAADMLGQAGDLMDDVKSMMVGPHDSLMMLTTSLPVEGEETSAFIRQIDESLSASCGAPYYLIGNSVMNREMEESFGRELLTISLLTASSIFLVVLVSFRRVIIAALLVLLVQCGVFLTVATGWLIGYRIYYLAVLIVQCILMGATVDYGILFSNYYRDRRKEQDVCTSLRDAYAGSIHTILTSSLFMIFGTGAIGFSPADPTITQICKSIAIGAVSAVLLVIFVLPGMLAALDRFVVRRRK